MSNYVWSFPKERKVEDNSKWQDKCYMPLAQSAREFPGANIDCRDDKALRCLHCDDVFSPIVGCVDCGSRQYFPRLLKGGGAALFCMQCNAQFYVWKCPSCGKENPTNTTIVSKKSGCFIATACYGSYHTPEVIILKRFRDNVLSFSMIGNLFIKVYYFFSPLIAEYIKNKDHAKNVLRKFLLEPLIKWINKRYELQ